MQRIVIDKVVFMMAFRRDVDYHDMCPLSTYLDLDTGKTIWVYENDEDASWEGGIDPEDNQENREQIGISPERYLKIPGLSHGNHHNILREFLNFDWTADEEVKSLIKNSYEGSIGGWMKNLDYDSNIIYAYYDYRDGTTEEMAEEFLHNHGIEPQWE